MMIAKSAWYDLVWSDREVMVNLSPSFTVSTGTAGLTGDIPIQSNNLDEKQSNTEVGHLCPLQAGNVEDD